MDRYRATKTQQAVSCPIMRDLFFWEKDLDYPTIWMEKFGV